MPYDLPDSDVAKSILKIFGDASVSHMHPYDAGGLIKELGAGGLIDALGARKKGQLADRQMKLKERFAPYQSVINPREDRSSRERIAGSKNELDRILFGRKEKWGREKFNREQGLRRDQLSERVKKNRSLEEYYRNKLMLDAQPKPEKPKPIKLPDMLNEQLQYESMQKFPNNAVKANAHYLTTKEVLEEIMTGRAAQGGAGAGATGGVPSAPAYKWGDPGETEQHKKPAWSPLRWAWWFDPYHAPFY